MIRVLIAAPYAAVRAGLHALLADAEDCAVVGEVGGSEEVERRFRDAALDIVLLQDEGEGDLSSVLDTLRDRAVGIVLLGDPQEAAPRLARAGMPGWACLPRNAEAAEIIAAVRAAAAGLIVMDSALAPTLTASLFAEDSGSPAAPGSEEALTAREREVLQLMASGLPNKTIAARLGISLHTAKFHVASILAKLGASSRTEAVTIGARRGYVTL